MEEREPVAVSDDHNAAPAASATLRAGVVGAGFIGAVHARSARLAGTRLAGVATSSAARGRAAAARLGAERAYATPEELASADGIDVVHVPFVYRFHPVVREARARVQGGALGAVRLIHGGYLQDWLSNRRGARAPGRGSPVCRPLPTARLPPACRPAP